MATEFSQNFKLPNFDVSSPPTKHTQLKTIAQLLDFNAKNNPNYIFCVQAERPLDDVKGPPLLRLTHKSFQAMTLNCQIWTQEHVKELQIPILDEKGTIAKGAPIALLLDSDIGLLAYFFALAGLGIPVRSPQHLSLEQV
jgi:hypothetical protein